MFQTEWIGIVKWNLMNQLLGQNLSWRSSNKGNKVGRRKKKRKQRRMNDGDNDELSVAETKRKRGEEKHKEEVCLPFQHTCTFLQSVCVIHRCGHGGRKKSAEDKGRKKTGGHRAQTGSQPNQFGLAESGCTISHQSTFSMLSDRPSIHRGHPLVGNRREKKERQRERERKETCAHVSRLPNFNTCLAPAVLPHLTYLNIPCWTKFRSLSCAHQRQWANKREAYQDVITLVIGCIMVHAAETCTTN